MNAFNTIDAKVWAKKFIEAVKENSSMVIDVETMTGWFANAIMTGYDAGYQKIKKDIKLSKLGKNEK